MQIICGKSELVKALRTAGYAEKSEGGKCLMVADAQGMTLTVSNNDMYLSVSVPNAQILHNGACVLDSAKKLTGIIASLPNDSLEMQSNEYTRSEDGKRVRLNRYEAEYGFDTVKVISGKFVWDFAVMGYDSFLFAKARGNDFTPYLTRTVSMKTLKDMIKSTEFAAAEYSDKPGLVGEMFKFAADKLEVVAVDGFRVAYSSCKVVDGRDTAGEALIPAPYCRLLERVFRETSEDLLVISFTQNQFKVENGGFVLVGNIIHSDFFKYENIFKPNYSTVVEVDRKELLEVLERVTVLCHEAYRNSAVDVTVEDKVLKIELADGMIGSKAKAVAEATDEVDCVTIGEEVITRYNSKYLIDALKAMKSKIVCWKLQGQFAGSLMGEKEGNVMYLAYFALPLRIVNKR